MDQPDPRPRGIPGQVALRGATPAAVAPLMAPWAVRWVLERPVGGSTVIVDCGSVPFGVVVFEVLDEPDEVVRQVRDEARHWPDHPIHV